MALKEAHSLPTDGGAEMPAANDDAEVARLAALGYDREGARAGGPHRQAFQRWAFDGSILVAALVISWRFGKF